VSSTPLQHYQWEAATMSLLELLVEASDSDLDTLGALTLLREHISEANDVLSDRPVLHHPLGFLQVRLYDFNGRTVRLHFWRSDSYRPRFPYWPVHAHPYSLRSLVLSGAVYQTTYQVDNAPDGPTHRVYEVEYRADGSTRRPTEHLVTAVPTRSYICSAGSRYEIPTSEYHQTTPHASPGITLVITGYPDGSPARVLGDVSIPAVHDYPVVQTADELRGACLRDFERLLI
jgi:hypothetical protein